MPPRDRSSDRSNETRFIPSDFGIGRLFGYVREGVIVANAQLERIVLWNAAAEEIFGFTEDEALDLPLYELVPEEFRDAHRKGIAGYQQTGTGKLLSSSGAIELEGLRKDGSRVPIDLTLTALPETSSSGERFALALVRDVTDRKAAHAIELQRMGLEQERAQAITLNDEIVQGLVVAKLSIESGDLKAGMAEITRTLDKARKIVSKLLEPPTDADKGS